MKHTHDYRVEVVVRNGDFKQVDEKTFSGKNSIVDAIFYLDEKYNPSAYEIIKRVL